MDEYVKERTKAMKEAISQVYDSKERVIIIGLTGRTGAGCSTVAKILETEKFNELDLKDVKQYDFKNSEERKERIIHKYMEQPNRWQPFSVIEVSGLILASVLELGYDKFCQYIDKITDEKQRETINIGEKHKVIESLTQINYMFEECQKYPLNPETCDLEKIDINEYYKFYLNTLKAYKKRFRDILDSYSCYETYNDKMKGKQQSKYHLYTYLMQQFGNNIRCSGNPFDDAFNEKKYRLFVNRILNLIKVINRYNEKNGVTSTRICIDAIRNPYEAMFLKDKYRSFYLMAINTTDQDRCNRLRNLTSEELKNLDTIEYAQKTKLPQEVFYHQSIESCLEYAGIHIFNPNINDEKYYELTSQLVKYITLMIHPGIITPSHIERCMQLAYNTKFNSGCLSRQVGAVVTREDFSIQSVGWNDVPKGQISCLLRDADSYCHNKDCETYSQFEIEDTAFSKAIKKINNSTQNKLHGRCMPYCFKDVYNSITGQKNQVYTRALHAEENAFLQISKYGGTQVNNGNLFTTASPCELCAKKAYQLGIKKIYYINPYPGISRTHILTFGENDNPEMILFNGAIGQTYIDFYEPRIATKDELELLTDVNVKDLIAKTNTPNQLKYSDIEYKSIEINFCFTKGRNEIECTRKIDSNILTDNFNEITRTIVWTGSSYDGTELIADESDNDIEFEQSMNVLPYTYTLKATRKKGESLKYRVLTKAKDEKNVMEPYLAHMVKHKTDSLILQVAFQKTDNNCISNVKATTYADLKMNTLVNEVPIQPLSDSSDQVIYKIEIPNANVNYTYAIEWKFESEK